MSLRDPILNRALRLNRKSKRLQDKTCEICGNDDDEALQVIRVAACANCRKELKGQSPVDNHHFPGRRWSSFTLPLPANDHADLTGWHYDYPRTANQNKYLAGLYARLSLAELLYRKIQAEIEEEENKTDGNP